MSEKPSSSSAASGPAASGSTESGASRKAATSSIGRKILMALTGLLVMGFVVAHLLGNLQIFLGQKAFNDYAAFLKSIPELLWPLRIGLLFAFTVHLWAAFSLRNTNRSARPEGYQVDKRVQASAASVYMFETGMAILFFVLVHLLHFTFGSLQPEYASLHDSLGRHDVYSMVIHGFRDKVYSALYILCMIMVGVHLSHGFGSLFATLGFGRAEFRKNANALGKLFAGALALGYISIPVAVLLGVLRLP